MVWGYGTSDPQGGWGWWGRMALGWLALVGFWLGVIVAAILLIRRAGDRQATASPPDNPLAILRRRYAAGEIDQATYLRMSQELGEASGSLA
jgi:putative membrane protein